MTATRQQVEKLGLDTYLEQQQHKSLLHFLTCGSVDDGKSTLIGRLLHDSQQLYDDQLSKLKQESSAIGTQAEGLDFALLVDGLQAEREQGITIDVAYRFFSTEKRKFIIADTPGHEQYTRNMATGASTCDLAIILVDARYGVQTQTKRHSFICSLLGIRQLVIAINKMDLVEYSEERFLAIQQEYVELATMLQCERIQFIPISALKGDNLLDKSPNMPWYEGDSLMTLLEEAPITHLDPNAPARFPVQYVNRPNLDFRGFAGTLSAGQLKPGDPIQVLPSGQQANIKKIHTFDGELTKATPGQAITLTLDREIDVSRGDLIVQANAAVKVSQQFTAYLVWLDDKPLPLHQLYDLKLAHKKTTALVEQLNYRLDINTLQKQKSETLALNDIGSASLTLTEAVACDPYQDCHTTGSFILIDRLTNATVAAGIIQSIDTKTVQSTKQFSEFELEFNALVRKHFPHWQAIDISQLS